MALIDLPANETIHEKPHLIVNQALPDALQSAMSDYCLSIRKQ